MKITNKSEVFKAAWKFFRANNITFSDALKMAWNSYRVTKQNEKALANKRELTEEQKMLSKAFNWARINVSTTFLSMDLGRFQDFYNEHKSEGTVWQLAARYARSEDSALHSFN